MKYPALILALILAFSHLSAHAQTKSVLKNIANNALTESLTVPTGQTLTIASGATIHAASGATITGFASLASPTFTGNVTAPNYLLSESLVDTLSDGQSGLGTRDGRTTLQFENGSLQMFQTGDPLESVLYWAGRFQVGSLEAASITGELDAGLITSGVIAGTIMNSSMPRPFFNFVDGPTNAGASGLTYGNTGPTGVNEPTTPGTYFPEILVTDGGDNRNYLEGRIRTASQLRSDLGLGTLATISPTGTADSTTYLRGDGSWQTISAGATPGGVVQRVVVNETARNLSGTGLVTYSNSAAQAMSSGTEFLSITITPTSASNRLRLVCVINLGVSSTVHLSMLCGRSGDTDARRQASVSSLGTRTDMIFTGILTLDEVAGTTSAITYKIRAGAHNTATTYLNRAGAGDYPFGTSSTVTVEEYTP